MPPMDVAAPRATVPLHEAAAPVFVRAPPERTPVPLRVSPSAVPRVKPLRSKAPPAETVVAPPMVPRGVLVASPAEPSFRVPAETVVRPE